MIRLHRDFDRAAIVTMLDVIGEAFGSAEKFRTAAHSQADGADNRALTCETSKDVYFHWRQMRDRLTRSIGADDYIKIRSRYANHMVPVCSAI